MDAFSRLGAYQLFLPTGSALNRDGRFSGVGRLIDEIRFTHGMHLVKHYCKFLLFTKVLAKKMTVLYKLASGQLSKQSHYDFGLRALKAVLVMAGELKRGSPDLSEVSFSSCLKRRNDYTSIYRNTQVVNLVKHCSTVKV